MTPKDRYEELPTQLKKVIDTRHGVTPEGVAPKSRKEELLQQAYERRAMAEQTLREAQETADRLLDDEAKILARLEFEEQEEARAKEIRQEASTLIDQATGKKA